MGESERYQEYKHLRKKRFTLGSENNALMTLVTLNVIGFLFLLTLQVAFFFDQQSQEIFTSRIVQWAQLPSTFNLFIQKPWTIFSFMFSDTSAGLWRILSNMVWLWSFGYLLQELAGNDKIIPVYIYGGMIGGLVFMGCGQAGLVQNDFSLIGANASVMAIAGAAVSSDPNYRVLTHIRKGIPVWVLLLIFLVIDFIGFFPVSIAYVFAHMGGLLAGFLFVVLLNNGMDTSQWMNRLFYTVGHLFTPNTMSKKPSTRNKMFYDASKRTPYLKNIRITQQRIDEILDKINEQGYEALTDEEKEFLKKAADENAE